MAGEELYNYVFNIVKTMTKEEFTECMRSFYMDAMIDAEIDYNFDETLRLAFEIESE